jgi:NDP-sugar pyrophosphorylase family protein
MTLEGDVPGEGEFSFSKAAALRDTSALVLCGGKGSRLGAAGLSTPKALTLVNGRPMLDYVSEHLRAEGFLEITLSTGFLSEKIEEFTTTRNDLSFSISNAGVEASMLNRIYSARSKLKEHVIVSYGDTFIDINYAEFLETHKASKHTATMVTGQFQNPFGVIKLGENGLVKEFVEKPLHDYYIGCFAFNRDALDTIPADLLDLPDGQGLVLWFQDLASKSQLGAYRHKGFQVTFNTESERLNADQHLKNYFSYYTVNEGT